MELRSKMSEQLLGVKNLWKCADVYLERGRRAVERLQGSGWSRVLCCSKAPASLKGWPKLQTTSITTVTLP